MAAPEFEPDIVIEKHQEEAKAEFPFTAASEELFMKNFWPDSATKG